MERIIVLLLVLLSFQPLARAEGVEVVPGLITANNVDITTDSGEILSERLGVGDAIYIIKNPENPKKGWVRVTRDESDKIGIGWVESKHIRSFTRWKAPEGSTPPQPTASEIAGEKTIFAPDFDSAKYSNVGILPFIAGDPGDATADKAFSEFVSAVEKSAKFRVTTEPLRGTNVDPDSTEQLKSLLSSQGLDGVFVGNVSPEIAGNRLLQIRFYGKDRDSFVLEKVKKLPSSGEIRGVVDELAKSCVETLTATP